MMHKTLFQVKPAGWGTHMVASSGNNGEQQLISSGQPLSETPSSSQDSEIAFPKREVIHFASPRSSTSTLSPLNTTTMSVPAILVPIVEAFIAAEGQLHSAECVFSDRTAALTRRLAARQEERDQSFARARLTAEASDGDASLDGLNLIERDLGLSRLDVDMLASLQERRNDNEVRQVECTLISQDVAQLQNEACQRLTHVESLLHMVAEQLLRDHKETMERNHQTWRDAQGALSSQESAVDEDLQRVARQCISRLETMYRRLSTISNQKTHVHEEVRSRLSVRDAYDPETTRLKRDTVTLQHEIELLTEQLTKIRALRDSVASVLGGADKMSKIVGEEWLALTTNALDSGVSSSGESTPVEQAPTSAVVPRIYSTTSAQQGRPFQQGRASAGPVKRGREEMEQTCDPTNDTSDNGNTARRVLTPSSGNLQATTKRPITASVPPTSTKPLQVKAEVAANTASADEEATPRRGVLGFFSAVLQRAITFDDDIVEVIEDDRSSNASSNDSSPHSKQRRVEFAAVGRPSDAAFHTPQSSQERSD